MASTNREGPAQKDKMAEKTAIAWTHSQANAKFNVRVSASGAIAKPYAAADSSHPTAGSATINRDAVLKNASEFNLMEQPLIIIFVGADDDMKEWNIHKNLLLTHSPFFRAALEESHFLEGETQTVCLPETDPAVFSHVVEWIYQQKVGVEEQGDIIKVYLDKKVAENPKLEEWLKNGKGGKDSEAMKELYSHDIKYVTEQLSEKARTYIDVWKLADFLCMPKLANHIIRRLINEFDPRKMKHEGGFDFLPLVSLCYAEDTNEDTLIRHWILKLFASGLAEFNMHDMYSYGGTLAMMKSNVGFLFDIQWFRSTWHDAQEKLRLKPEMTTSAFLRAEKTLMLKED